MLPAPLWLSLLFNGFICHFGLLFQTPFCKWRWRRRQRRTAATAASFLVVTSNTRCLLRERLPRLRPQCDVSCAKTPSRPVPWRIEQNAPGLAPIACALLWSSPGLPSSEHDTRPALALAHPGQLSLYPNRSKSFCAMALVALVEVQIQRNCRVWLQHRRSDPNSTAIIFQCIWCQFTAECFVQQAASPSFA